MEKGIQVRCLWLYLSAIIQIIGTAALTILPGETMDTGAKDLIVENFLSNTNERLKNGQIAEILHSSQTGIIKEEIKGTYKTLNKHPTVMERRFKVGNRQPPSMDSYSKQKKVITIGIPQPTCPFTTSWVLITRAYDMNNTEVEVFQPMDGSDIFQWFYAVNCNTEVLKNENEACPFCCRGINHDEYASECMPTKSYVMALIRRPGDITYEWELHSDEHKL